MKAVVLVGLLSVVASGCGDTSASNGAMDLAGPADTDLSIPPFDDLGDSPDLTPVEDFAPPPCLIDAVAYEDGAVNPTNACQVCAIGASTTAWSNRPSGTACSDGQICASGTCAAQCAIDGTIYAAGAANPTESCQICQPATSTTAWSHVDDATACGDALVCQSGTCGSGCVIDSASYDPNAASPTNACDVCAPSVSTAAWTTRPDGTSCGTAKICDGGGCASACLIDNATYDDGVANPTTACQTCVAETTNYAWTNQPTGQSCATDKVCNASGQCTTACFIGGALRAPNSGTGCQRCQPSVSTSAWTTTVGAACGSGSVCNASAQCVQACFIDGVVHAAGAANPSNPCQVCASYLNKNAWTNQAELTSCGTNRFCSYGACQRGQLFEWTGGRQTYKVPAGSTMVTVEAIGASGGAVVGTAPGAPGGIVKATLVTTPGENLSINVGGGGGSPCGREGGWNGGGDGGYGVSGVGDPAGGCGGGGESDIRRGGTDIGKRVLVAGGGGGDGATMGRGGSGGGANGGGGGGWSGMPGGYGGTQSAGGQPGPYFTGELTEAAKAGAPNEGGEGASTELGGGGGGGGGYYGGGGGGDRFGGGGGGSGWAVSGSTSITSQNGVAGSSNTIHGRIVVFY